MAAFLDNLIKTLHIVDLEFFSTYQKFKVVSLTKNKIISNHFPQILATVSI